MPVYNFDYQNVDSPLNQVDQRFNPRHDGIRTSDKVMSTLPQPDSKQRDDIWFDTINIDKSTEVHEFMHQGYKTIDRGMKNFFSGIMIPTPNGIKPMQVRLSGGDKPYLIWAQDLKYGRVSLPVLSIKRESEEFNPIKYGPAIMPVSKRFIDTVKSRVAVGYRPISSLLKYNVSMWAEHKADLEYFLYWVRVRFNPEADFYVEDEKLRMNIFTKYGGMTINIDDDVPVDQRANKRYDYSFVAEGYLPLPEKIFPSILGRVTILKDGSPKKSYSEVLATLQGRDNANYI